MTRKQVQEWADRLVRQLEQWDREQNRGPLARLRRGLSEATRFEAWPVLGRLFGELAVGHPVFEGVAGCFALHPVQWKPDNDPKEDMKRNFGWTYRNVRLAEPNGAEKMRDEKEPHTRFRRLLACGSKDEICQHVRHAVRLAKSRTVSVNYRKLFEDLWWWNERTKIEWAKAYWQVPLESEEFSLAGIGSPVEEGEALIPEE